MFNNEVKKYYLDNLKSESLKFSAASIFKNSEEYEKHFDKDLCDFIEPEIIEYLTSMGASSFISLYSKCSVMRTYTQWCIEQKRSKDNINHFDSITREIIRKCVNKSGERKKYVTYENLKELTKDFVNISDDALCYCLFFGIYGKKGEEIINLTEDDIDMGQSSVRLITGRTVELPQEVITVLLKSCNEYNYNTWNKQKDYTFSFDLRDRSVFKRRNNTQHNDEKSNQARILKRLNKLKTATGCQALGVSRLRNSGLLWSINNYLKDHPVAYEEIYDDPEIREIYRKWDMTFPPIKRAFYDKLKEYYQDDFDTGK